MIVVCKIIIILKLTKFKYLQELDVLLSTNLVEDFLLLGFNNIVLLLAALDAPHDPLEVLLRHLLIVGDEKGRRLALQSLVEVQDASVLVDVDHVEVELPTVDNDKSRV